MPPFRFSTGKDTEAVTRGSPAKGVGAGTVLRFHEGRGAQEEIFGELKTHCAMGHVPVRRRLGNQMYLLAGLLAHNLIRELQMQTGKRSRGTTDNPRGAVDTRNGRHGAQDTAAACRALDPPERKAHADHQRNRHGERETARHARPPMPGRVRNRHETHATLGVTVAAAIRYLGRPTVHGSLHAAVVHAVQSGL